MEFHTNPQMMQNKLPRSRPATQTAASRPYKQDRTQMDIRSDIKVYHPALISAFPLMCHVGTVARALVGSSTKHNSSPIFVLREYQDGQAQPTLSCLVAAMAALALLASSPTVSATTHMSSTRTQVACAGQTAMRANSSQDHLWQENPYSTCHKSGIRDAGEIGQFHSRRSLLKVILK